MPLLRQREQALRHELNALVEQTRDGAAHLRLAETCLETKKTAPDAEPKEMTMRTLVLAATVVTLAALMPSPNHAQSGTDLGPITDQTLRQPAPEDWLTTRRTRNGWAHSPLDQINHGNVHKMQVVWDEQVDDENGHGTPLVHKGVMYLRRGDDRIEARQAATGKTLWTYYRDQQTGPKWQGRQEDDRGFGIFQSASGVAARVRCASSACLFTIGEEWALRWAQPSGAPGKAPPGRRWSDRVLRRPSRGRSAVWSPPSFPTS